MDKRDSEKCQKCEKLDREILKLQEQITILQCRIANKEDDYLEMQSHYC